ncbi:MAG: 1-acyl-sn-glycerol-3-phosphate acyltransferase [Thermodesulfovibrionales bacterium]|nr:1-acyl-sn-glycerol-3-phosphate acyltransferase [Thermodesulfovibrionales bacterium]
MSIIISNLLFCVFVVPILLLLRITRIPHNSVLLKSVNVWAKTNCRLLGIVVEKKGSKPQHGGAFIPCNHLSYTDIPVIASVMPCVFVSKEEVKRWPIFGILSMTAGTIFVNRSSKKSTYSAIKYAERVLSQGTNIVVFPEATTSDGKVIKRFNSAFFFLPERLDVRVQPVVISYLDDDSKPISHKVAWYGDMNIFIHLWNITGMTRIKAVVHFCDVINNNQENKLNRKDLALLCEKSVREVFEKIN